MGRPSKIEPLQVVITKMMARHPSWDDKDIKCKLEEYLLTKIREEHPEYNQTQIQAELAKKLPGDLTIRDFRLATYKPNQEKVEASGLDNPWHLGTLIDKPLPPEAIPELLALQEWNKKEHSEIMYFRNEAITIRQALWVARILGILTLLRSDKHRKTDLYRWLWEWSYTYAQYERVCTLSKEIFNTSILDNAIWQGYYPVSGYFEPGAKYPCIDIHNPETGEVITI
jgi:hypothetical protein